jgi:hypothetical protein
MAPGRGLYDGNLGRMLNVLGILIGSSGEYLIRMLFSCCIEMPAREAK